MFDKNTYEEDVSTFKKILSNEGDNILANESKAVIYVGRESCPYCQKFVKKLSKVKKQVNDIIYYIDSSNSFDDNLSFFRDKYNIITVPGFIVKKNNEFDVRCDSSIPEEELINMIK